MAAATATYTVENREITLPDGPVSYEEFLAWAKDDLRAEWIDGRVEPRISPVSLAHVQLNGFLATCLCLFLEDRDYGTVLTSPFQMHLAAVRSGREPDIMVVLRERENLIRRNFLDGPADLAIEIISPESVDRERIEKFAEYEQGGVREFWLLDPETQGSDFFVLGPDGRYQPVAPDADGIYRSAVLPGFWINVGWLWQSPLPTVRSVLRAWEQSPQPEQQEQGS